MRDALTLNNICVVITIFVIDNVIGILLNNNKVSLYDTKNHALVEARILNSMLYRFGKNVTQKSAFNLVRNFGPTYISSVIFIGNQIIWDC